LLALGAEWRKRVLEASQRAVVAIRALQDLVMGDACYVSWCCQAVREVEKIEGDLKGPEVSTQRREGRGETQQKGRPKGTDGRA
jgi:glutamyl/glutaminyl-tRNA synthetase